MNEHTTRTYADVFAPTGVSVLTEVPEGNVFKVPAGVSIVEVAIQEVAEGQVEIVLVLPRPIQGRRITIVNNSNVASSSDGYYIKVGEILEGILVEKDIPALYNPSNRIAEFLAGSYMWSVTGISIADSVGVMWNMLKYDTLRWFGDSIFADDIDLIYEEEEFQVTSTTAMVIVSTEENSESHTLALHLPLSFDCVGKMVTINQNLTGSAVHVLDVYTAENAFTSDLPNGTHTFRCLGDLSTRYVTWLPISFIEH